MNDDYKMKTLYIIPPKMSMYAKGSNGETIWMLCLIKNHKLFKKINYICNKFGNSIKKDLDSEPIYHKKF